MAPPDEPLRLCLPGGVLAGVWRGAYGRRWRRVLGFARRVHQINARELADVEVLTDEQRRVLLVALRRTAVRSAARAPTGAVMIAVFALVAASCLVGPPAFVGLVAHPDLSPAGLLVAVGLYLTMFGLAGAAYFRRRIFLVRRRELTLLSLFGAVVSCAGTVVAATIVALRDGGEALRTPVVLGVLAGFLAGFVIILIRRLILVMEIPVLGWRLRQCGTLPPSQLVAARLTVLLMQFNEVRGQWRQRRERAMLLGHMSWTILLIERWIPQVMWWSGIRGNALDPAVRRCWDAGAVLRAIRWELADAGTASAFDQLQRRLAAAAAAVAAGDWSGLTSDERPSRASRLLALARRLVTPAVLATAAIALPYLPGVDAGGTATTTVRIGLLVAALLQLTSTDGTAQDRILTAVRESYQTKP